MADAVRDLSVVAASREEHVAVAGAVDDLLRENRLLALLRFEDDAEDPVPLLDDIDAPAVEEHVDLLLGDHRIHQVLRAFGVHRRLPVGPLQLRGARTAHVVAERDRAVRELLREAARDEPPRAARELLGGAEHDEHHAVREESAQRAVAFDERDLRARAGGGDGGGEAGGAAADHDDVRLVEDRHLARRADDLAVLERAARAVFDRVAEREDVLAEPDVVRIAHRAGRQAVRRLHKLVRHKRRARQGRATDAEALQELSLADVHRRFLLI